MKKLQILNQNRQYWYMMANSPFEFDSLKLRTVRHLLVLIRVYPCESVADFSLCTNLPWRDLAEVANFL